MRPLAVGFCCTMEFLRNLVFEPHERNRVWGREAERCKDGLYVFGDAVICLVGISNLVGGLVITIKFLYDSFTFG